jgi:hypothetical protein
MFGTRFYVRYSNSGQQKKSKGDTGRELPCWVLQGAERVRVHSAT